MKPLKLKFFNFVRNQLAAGDHKATNHGIVVADGILLRGKYTTMVNGKDPQVDYNLMPAAAILHMLDVTLRNQTRYASWYVALFSGATAPASTWTAANFSANATEITSSSEGYTEATRQLWVPAAASAGKITNAASMAHFTIATASSVTVRGVALLSDSAKGSTTGVLASAAQITPARTLYDTDTHDAEFSVELTDTV